LEEIKVEYLYSARDGHDGPASENLDLAIEITGIPVKLIYTEIPDIEEALRKSFLGTPSIRVEGKDVEYGDRPPEEVQIGTRYYNTPEGWKPYPHTKLIANAILEAHNRKGEN
jgi:hypothetical protein